MTFTQANDGHQVPIYSISERPGFDYMFDLDTNGEYSEAILDCQSFTNRFKLIQGEQVLLNLYLYNSECRELFRVISNATASGEQVCLYANENVLEWDYGNCE